MPTIVEVDENFSYKLPAEASFNEVWLLPLCIDIPLQKELFMLINWDLDLFDLLFSIHHDVFELLPMDAQYFFAVIFLSKTHVYATFIILKFHELLQ